MLILITGGAGFIGSAVIRYIIQNTRHSVVNIDKLTYAGNLESLTDISNSNRYVFKQIDINDRIAVSHLLEQYEPDAIMHLAAESHVDRSIDDSGDFIQTNIVGTFNLLEAARAYWLVQSGVKKESFRFHHISTDEVYGDLPLDTNILFSEDTRYLPNNPYSASKAASDHLVRAWKHTYGYPTLVTNCSNNYGPYQFPEKFIPHIIINALHNKPLPVYGDGQQIRDWLFVEDHACALVKVITEGKVGETYNIGGHNEKKNIDVVMEICQLLEELAPEYKAKNNKNYSDLITFVTDRPGHDKRYAIDATKMHTELKWSPRETFNSGLRKTVKWYLENEGWWKRVLNDTYRLERIGRG